jgi:predicted nucleotidyltransferase
LAKTSVWAGLAALEQMGAVAVAGSGRARLYSMRSACPLCASLDALFDAEERRFQDILAAMRKAARSCEQETAAVWLYGSVARGEDQPSSDLDLVLVGTESSAPATLDAVRDALSAAGEALGFAASVVALGTADIARLSKALDPWWAEVARDAIVIEGRRPDELAGLPRARAKRRAAA